MPRVNITLLEDVKDRLEKTLKVTKQEVIDTPVENLGSSKVQCMLTVGGQLDACLLAIDECLRNYE